MYGNTIKIIRLNKGLPLKSVYIGICSKTNAIKFEKGDRQLAVEKFNRVLDNLMINMDEFLWIQNGYKPQKNIYHEYMLISSWNSNNLKEFEQQIQAIETDTYGIERVQLASYRLLRAYEQQILPNQKELEIAVNYFSNLSSWTLTDIRFFSNNCYVLPYSLTKNLLKEVLKVKNRYKYYRNSDMIFAMVLTNCIDKMITEKDIASAMSTLKLLKKVTTEITMAGFRLLADYYEAKIDFLYNDSLSGKKKLIKVLNIAYFFDNKQLTSEIQKLLDPKL